MVYLGQYGKSHIYKIGESVRTSKRKWDINHKEEYIQYTCKGNFDFVCLFGKDLSKEQGLYIEDYIRNGLIEAGCKQVALDHFVLYKKDIALVRALYEEAVKGVH